MEGFLIRVPTCAWESDSEGISAGSKKGKLSRRSCKPQARLLYYILGEGYLEGFATPDDVEPIETIQLTSFQVEVEPIYSMSMFRLTTHEKKPLGHRPQAHAITDHLSGDSSDESESDGDNTAFKPPGSSILLFAGSKALVEKWGKKILNWNRYVFAGGDGGDADASDLVKTKSDLITAFNDHNNRGMFALSCQLEDATKTLPFSSDGTVSLDDVTMKENIPPLPTTKPVDTVKPGSGDIKPLWMLLQRGSSRRISAVPSRK